MNGAFNAEKHEKRFLICPFHLNDYLLSMAHLGGAAEDIEVLIWPEGGPLMEDGGPTIKG